MCFWNFIPEKWNFRILKKAHRLKFGVGGKVNSPDGVKWTVAKVDGQSKVHPFYNPRTFEDCPLSFFGPFTLCPFGPSTFTQLDRRLSPKTVHFHLDPKFEQHKNCVGEGKNSKIQYLNMQNFPLGFSFFISTIPDNSMNIAMCRWPKIQCWAYDRKIFSKFEIFRLSRN